MNATIKLIEDAKGVVAGKYSCQGLSQDPSCLSFEQVVS